MTSVDLKVQVVLQVKEEGYKIKVRVRLDLKAKLKSEMEATIK